MRGQVSARWLWAYEANKVPALMRDGSAKMSAMTPTPAGIPTAALPRQCPTHGRDVDVERMQKLPGIADSRAIRASDRQFPDAVPRVLDRNQPARFQNRSTFVDDYGEPPIH